MLLADAPSVKRDVSRDPDGFGRFGRRSRRRGILAHATDATILLDIANSAGVASAKNLALGCESHGPPLTLSRRRCVGGSLCDRGPASVVGLSGLVWPGQEPHFSCFSSQRAFLFPITSDLAA
jgi:hypothetical protein